MLTRIIQTIVMMLVCLLVATGCSTSWRYQLDETALDSTNSIQATHAEEGFVEPYVKTRPRQPFSITMNYSRESTMANPLGGYHKREPFLDAGGGRILISREKDLPRLEAWHRQCSMKLYGKDIRSEFGTPVDLMVSQIASMMRKVNELYAALPAEAFRNSAGHGTKGKNDKKAFHSVDIDLLAPKIARALKAAGPGDYVCYWAEDRVSKVTKSIGNIISFARSVSKDPDDKRKNDVAADNERRPACGLIWVQKPNMPYYQIIETGSVLSTLTRTATASPPSGEPTMSFRLFRTADYRNFNKETASTKTPIIVVPFSE